MFSACQEGLCTAPPQEPFPHALVPGRCVSIWVHVSACACMHACVCARARGGVCVCVCVMQRTEASNHSAPARDKLQLSDKWVRRATDFYHPQTSCMSCLATKAAERSCGGGRRAGVSGWWLLLESSAAFRCLGGTQHPGSHLTIWHSPWMRFHHWPAAVISSHTTLVHSWRSLGSLCGEGMSVLGNQEQG